MNDKICYFLASAWLGGVMVMPALAQKPAQREVEAPAPASAPAAESNPPNPQPRLSGMDSVDRMPGSQSDLDLLEIPAFLRRQVN